MYAPPPLHVNTQYIQQYLPNQPMYVPPIPTADPQRLPYLTGLTMLKLQNEASRSVFRTFIFNVMSNAGYQNAEFSAMMNLIDGMTSLEVSRGVPVQQAMEFAVENGVLWTMASRVLQAGPAMAPYLDPQTQTDFVTYVNHARNKLNELAAMRTAPAAMPHAPMPHAPMHHMPMNHQHVQTYGQVQHQTFPQYTYLAAASADSKGAVQGRYADSATASPSAPAAIPPPIHSEVLSRFGSIQDQEPVMSEQQSRPKPKIVWGVPGNTAAPAPAPAPAMLVKEVPAAETAQPEIPPYVPPTPVLEASPEDFMEVAGDELPQPEPKVVPNRPFDRIDAGATVIIPAHLAEGITRTWTMHRPYGFVYDVTEYLPAYSIEKEGGVVEQTLLEWTEEMDYLKHELNADLRAREQRRLDAFSGKVQRFNFQSIQKVTRVDNEFMGKLDVPKEAYSWDLELTPVVETSFKEHDNNLVADFIEYLGSVTARLTEKGEPGMRAQPIEMYIDRVGDAFAVPVEFADTVRLLKSSGTWSDLVGLMGDLSTVLDNEVMASLDVLATRLINAHLTEGLGLPLTVDSLLGDWHDLVTSLRSSYGDDLLDMMEATASDYIRSGMRFMDSDLALTYTEAMNNGEEIVEVDEVTVEEDEEDLEDRVAALLGGDEDEPAVADESISNVEYELIYPVRRISVTTMPIKLDHTDLNLDHGSQVSPVYLPKLHAGLKALLERTVDSPVPYADRYLLTSDAKVLKVVRGCLVEDSILLYKSNLTAV